MGEAKGQAEKLGGQLKNLGVSPGEAAVAANRAGPPIAGQVREVRDIAGRKYATISVGSAEGVAPGVEFKVISRAGDFLGTLVVDSVEPDSHSPDTTLSLASAHPDVWLWAAAGHAEPANDRLIRDAPTSAA